MPDQNLQQLLRQTAYVERAQIALGGAGNPLSPQFVRETEPRAVLVQPLRGELAATLMGKLPAATHVGYMAAPAAVAPADVLVVVAPEAEARYEILAVEDEGGQGHHLRLILKRIDE